jgi:hypothetical protein
MVNTLREEAYAALKGSRVEVDLPTCCAVLAVISETFGDLAENCQKPSRRRLYLAIALDFAIAAARGAEGKEAWAGVTRTVIRLPRCVCALVAKVLQEHEEWQDVEAPELLQMLEALHEAGIPGPDEDAGKRWWQVWR